MFIFESSENIKLSRKSTRNQITKSRKQDKKVRYTINNNFLMGFLVVKYFKSRLKIFCLQFIRKKMENPAKCATLPPRELKLPDLDDDALIMIIDKLDHKSMLQMMASCKRFEGLIGNTHQFYKNFKICVNQKLLLERKETHHLEMIRRMFGTVNISSGAERRIRNF